MRFLIPLVLASSALATPALPVANGHTPGSLVSGLAVKRDWTLEDNGFCRQRAAAAASISHPQKASSKFKYIRTFSFRTRSTASHERLMLDYTNAGLQVPFPWQDGQWLSRQYTSQATPNHTYLLEMQDQPKAQGSYTTVASACITVFGLR